LAEEENIKDKDTWAFNGMFAVLYGLFGEFEICDSPE